MNAVGELHQTLRPLHARRSPAEYALSAKSDTAAPQSAVTSENSVRASILSIHEAAKMIGRSVDTTAEIELENSWRRNVSRVDSRCESMSGSLRTAGHRFNPGTHPVDLLSLQKLKGSIEIMEAHPAYFMLPVPGIESTTRKSVVSKKPTANSGLTTSWAQFRKWASYKNANISHGSGWPMRKISRGGLVNPFRGLRSGAEAKILLDLVGGENATGALAEKSTIPAKGDRGLSEFSTCSDRTLNQHEDDITALALWWAAPDQ